MTLDRQWTGLEADAGALRQMLIAARERSLALVGDLTDKQLLGPRLSIVNPPLWEIGHLGWFQERWCLRGRGDGALAPSMLAHADALYDSAAVPHETRWDLPLPALEATLAYLKAVLEAVSERLSRESDRNEIAYFAQLAALHEEMHSEAFTYTRHTLAYTAPPGTSSERHADVAGAWPGDSEIAGGQFILGARPGEGFVFDNEKWAHCVIVEPFRIARAAVTNRAFAAFVDDRGYESEKLWGIEGWRWRLSSGARHPVYWTGNAGSWRERHFDEMIPLAPDLPVMHVNWYEADAYCRWANRRLPTEAEWEYAAATTPRDHGAKRRYPWGDSAPDVRRANLFGAAGGRISVAALAEGDSAWGCRQMIGNVWEWTADAFQPYPGFIADPYKEYSEPWFRDHMVLRGGSHATRAFLIRNTWRNFYTPDRRDVFAGFRTCAR